jgi:uncharacterized delta-60 repeat protein
MLIFLVVATVTGCNGNSGQSATGGPTPLSDSSKQNGNSSENFSLDQAMFQYSPQYSGTLDHSFGNKGLIEFNGEYGGKYAGEEDQIHLGRQSTGKIIAVRNIQASGDWLPVTVRFSEDGSLDRTFGNNGYSAIMPPSGGYTYRFNDSRITVQQDDKILIATEPSIGIYRLNSDGTLDQSFGKGGFVSLSEWDWQGLSHVNHITATRDGSIFIGLQSSAIVRLNGDGTTNLSFGTKGLIKIGVRPTTLVNQAETWFTIDKAGSITVVGTLSSNSNPSSSDRQVALERFSMNGTHDQSFGHQGFVLTGISSPDGKLALGKLAIDNRERLILAGFSTGSTSTDLRTQVIRFNHDGSLDTTFGQNGHASFDLGENGTARSSTPVISEVRPDGRILLGLQLYDNSAETFGVLQLTENGDYDHEFNGKGFWLSFPSASSPQLPHIQDLIRDGQGRIYVANFTGCVKDFCEDQAFSTETVYRVMP